MKRIFRFVFMLSIFCLYLSCRTETPDPLQNNTLTGLKKLQEVSDKLRDITSPKQRLAVWNKQLQYPAFSTDPVLRAKIHYQIAGIYYGMGVLDSIKYHMQLAWKLMENKAGYEEEKALLYSGLGNIAHLERKNHQENYYYNRAAQMLVADSSLKLTPKQKITLYFAAAQSSAKLRQFDNAFLMNRKAIAILPQLQNNGKEKFRAYSQMAACYSSSNRNLDSLYFFIKKMESAYINAPGETNLRFLVDRKSMYFMQKKEMDSALYYARKRLELDNWETKNYGEKAENITTGNAFIANCDMAGIFTYRHQLDSAAVYLQKCKAFIRKYRQNIDEENLMLYDQFVVNYLFARKKYTEAEQHQEVLTRRTKFLYETENARAVSEMSTLFQLQAKDKSIQNLNQAIILSKTQLQRNRLWLAVTALACLLAIALALLLYFIQRQRKLRTETERAQLEQRLLRTQMEPHFIFNTLSALQSFIRFNDHEKALKYLSQFGKLLRSSLQLSRESFVKLSEEIDALQNYLSLQQMRYNNAFEYNITVNESEDLAAIYVPPMLMQPFVENAIVHGINPNTHTGNIAVRLKIQQHLLLVEIEDNGKGFSVGTQNSAHQSLSIAISKERLAILAKESKLAAGIEFESHENAGTTVTLTIPLKSATK